MDPHPKTSARRVVEAQGEELAALLAPISPQTFVSEHWGKKTLFVKGAADKYRGLFDAAAFHKAAFEKPRGAGPGEHLRASFDKKTAPRPGDGPATAVANTFPIAPESIGALFEAGATICLAEIDKRVPRLAYFAAAIKRQLGYPGPVAFNAYYSPPGSGFNWHFDGRIASTLQIEGTKKWRYSKRAAVEWPRGNAVVLSDGTARYDMNLARAEWETIAFDKRDVAEVVLEPGDLLILPAGTWHDACGGPTGSLALNLAFNPVSYSAMMGDLLDALLASDPGWRCARPLLPKLDGAPGEVDPRTLEVVRQQLQRAADALGRLAADAAPVTSVWSTWVQGDGPAVDEPAPDKGPIAPADRFRVRADGNVYVRTAEGETMLSVGVGTRPRAELTGAAMTFAQRALAARRFEASAGTGWTVSGTLEWSEVERHLRALLDQGLLERVNK